MNSECLCGIFLLDIWLKIVTLSCSRNSSCLTSAFQAHGAWFEDQLSKLSSMTEKRDTGWEGRVKSFMATYTVEMTKTKTCTLTKKKIYIKPGWSSSLWVQILEDHHNDLCPHALTSMVSHMKLPVVCHCRDSLPRTKQDPSKSLSCSSFSNDTILCLVDVSNGKHPFAFLLELLLLPHLLRSFWCHADIHAVSARPISNSYPQLCSRDSTT